MDICKIAVLHNKVSTNLQNTFQNLYYHLSQTKVSKFHFNKHAHETIKKILEVIKKLHSFLIFNFIATKYISNKMQNIWLLQNVCAAFLELRLWNHANNMKWNNHYQNFINYGKNYSYFNWEFHLTLTKLVKCLLY